MTLSPLSLTEMKGVFKVTREELMAELLAAPEQIMAAEKELLVASDALRWAEAALEDAKVNYLNGKAPADDGHWFAPAEPLINGKNAEQRDAQLKELTKRERAAVQAAAADVERRRAALRLAENRFRALRSVAALLAGEQVAA